MVKCHEVDSLNSRYRIEFESTIFVCIRIKGCKPKFIKFVSATYDTLDREREIKERTQCEDHRDQGEYMKFKGFGFVGGGGIDGWEVVGKEDISWDDLVPANL